MLVELFCISVSVLPLKRRSRGCNVSRECIFDIKLCLLLDPTAAILGCARNHTLQHVPRNWVTSTPPPKPIGSQNTTQQPISLTKSLVSTQLAHAQEEPP